MAYISITPNRPQVGRGNGFRVNGSDIVGIYGPAIHKVADGEYTVLIRSANGECWECEGDLNTRRACSICMSIRLAVDAEGNIVDVEYATFPLNTQQEGAYMFSPKLKLTFNDKAAFEASAKQEEPANEPEEIEEFNEEDLPEFEDVSDEDLTAFEEEALDDASEPPPVYERTSTKKGGTGWIVFGVICLLTAVANITVVPTLLGCGALGVICLLVGIKKKKG